VCVCVWVCVLLGPISNLGLFVWLCVVM